MTVIGFPNNNTEEYLSRTQIADILGVHVKTVDRWVKAGMPSELWGPAKKTRRFQKSKVLAWLRSDGTMAA